MSTQSQCRVLLAGASGYLGRHVLGELLKRKCRVRALVLPTEVAHLAAELGDTAEVVGGDAARPETLNGVVEAQDVVISCLSAAGGDFWAVDRSGNIALFRHALAAGAKHFILVATYEGKHSRAISEFSEAKEQAVDVVKTEGTAEGIGWTIIRPTAYYKDLASYAWNNIRKDGIHRVVGSGQTRINSIHGADLAEYICDCVLNPAVYGCELPIGGPDAFTMEEIGFLAADAMNRSDGIRVRRIPLPVLSGVAGVLSLAGVFSQRARRKAALVKWMRYAFMHDAVGTPFGRRRLVDHFRAMAEKSGRSQQSAQDCE